MFPGTLYPAAEYPASLFPGAAKAASPGGPGSLSGILLYPPGLYPAAIDPTSLFPGSAGSGSSAGSLAGIPLYPGGIYPASLFPNQPFPGTGATAPAPLPPTFLAAIKAALEGSDIAPDVPGGFWQKRVPPGLPRPAVTFNVTSGTAERIGGRHYLQAGRVVVSAYSRDPELARSIADRIVALLVDDYALAWLGGHVTYFSLADPTSAGLPFAGPGGSWTREGTRVFEYQLQGDFAR